MNSWPFYLVSVLFGLLLFGCGENGPSESELIDAIEGNRDVLVKCDAINRYGGSVWGRVAAISEIEVLERGKQSTEPGNEYWPVEVRISGDCRAKHTNQMYTFTGFEGVLHVIYDDFGEPSVRPPR